jgi:hypothetical protein
VKVYPKGEGSYTVSTHIMDPENFVYDAETDEVVTSDTGDPH